MAPLSRDEGRIEWRGGGEDGVEMRGEDDDGTGAVSGKMRRGDEADDVADSVSVDVDESDLGEASGEPIRTSFFAEGWRGNGDEFGLAIDEGLGVVVHPCERSVNRALSGDCRDAGECRAAREDRHVLSG